MKAAIEQVVPAPDRVFIIRGAGKRCLEPVMDSVGGFYLVRALGIDRASTELLGRPA